MHEIKNVVIWGLSNYNWLWVPLAEAMKKRLGAKIHFICSASQHVAYWEKQDRVHIIDSLVTTNHLFFAYDQCPADVLGVYREARAYEKKYATLVVDALQSDRHLGRGFSAAGIGHPRSILSNKATYSKSVHLFNSAIRLWEDYFDRIKPDVIIGVSSGVLGKTCSVVARSYGIPIRVFIPSKYQSYFYWGVDEYYSSPEIEKQFAAMKDPDTLAGSEEIRDLKRLPWSDQNYQRFKRAGSTYAFLKEILLQASITVRQRYKGVISPKSYTLPKRLRSVYQMYRTIRCLAKQKFVDINDLRGTSYVFYPLHVEPETALSLLNPEFNEQLALIELVAKNLPAGTVLVVKDHLGAVSRRPRDFYATLLDIPNVVMASPFSYALEIARNARCVIVITGTIGTEAVILGIPVISFGVHNSFNFLPSVHVVTSWKELRPLLSHICCGEDTVEEKRRRQEDGKKYLAALKASSIDLHWSNYASKHREPATEKEVEAIYSSLIKTLKH